MKNLIIILSETRQSDLTFNRFKINVYDRMDADLCICIGLTDKYNYDDKFYNLSKYKFLYKEPDDFASAFDYAYDSIIKDRSRFEKINHYNVSDKNLVELDYIDDINDIDLESYKDINELVYYNNKYRDKNLRNKLFKITNFDIRSTYKDNNSFLFRKPLHWREFLKIKDQF